MNIFDNIIIGAGPAGLQLAYFFHINKIKYVIFEKNDNCGSFFNHYPHSGKLISINKIHNGKDDPDFNLRHDWNSLLNNDNFLFKNYSKEYYPESKDLHKYLNDFASHFNLNIIFNTNVKCVNRNNQGSYEITVNDNEIYKCDKLIVSSGLSVPIISPLNKELNDDKSVLHYSQIPKNFFKNKDNLNKYINKKVAIVGGGNASYELGNLLMNYCSSILIFNNAINKRKDLSIVSHYSGDVRSVYYPFFDSFYLKSLNAIASHGDVKDLKIKRISDIDDKDYNKFILINNNTNNTYFSVKESNIYDEIILCTGWKFDSSIYNFDIKVTDNKKYPLTKYNYESVNNPNLFFIGSLMHVHDKGSSSGGFIHGFRYLIKLFTKINYNIPHDYVTFSFNGTLECYKELCNHIIHRVNYASSLYQMYGILCDIFFYNKESKKIFYYHDLTISVANQMFSSRDYNVVMLKYGDKITQLDQLGRFYLDDPKFLHCWIGMVERKDDYVRLANKIKLPEELFMDFSDENYYNLFYKAIKSCNLII